MSTKPLLLAFSTCPNDTFMFDALVNGKIESRGHHFELRMADIEELNGMVVQGIPDISKLSIATLPRVADQYELLHAGAAIGFGNGPLLVSRKKIYPDELADVQIAIPGEKTTANLLLSLLYPEAQNKRTYLFSSIEEVILDRECDAGLLIHETRFTYEKRGLKKIVDLGEVWEKRIGLPLPLGGIVIRRSLPVALKKEIETLLSQSVQFAIDQPWQALSFMKQYAQELSEEVIYKHVNLYVNDFSVNVQEAGEKAVVTLLRMASDAGLLPGLTGDLFLES